MANADPIAILVESHFHLVEGETRTRDEVYAYYEGLRNGSPVTTATKLEEAMTERDFQRLLHDCELQTLLAPLKIAASDNRWLPLDLLHHFAEVVRRLSSTEQWPSSSASLRYISIRVDTNSRTFTAFAGEKGIPALYETLALAEAWL